MSDGRKDVNETNTRVNDWEVVSLTASVYAAAPGPQEFNPSVQHKDDECNKTDQESSDTVIMSKHFSILPYEPENLPREPFCGEIHKEQGIHYEDITEPNKFTRDKCTVNLENDLHRSQLNDMGHSLSDHSMDFVDEMEEEVQKNVGKEQTFYVSANYNPFHDEADMSQSLIHDAPNLVESKHPSEGKVDYPPGLADGCKPEEENNQGSSDEYHEAWWKKRAMYVYNNTKGTNTFLSIFVAVAVVGIVILGHRWRREKSHFHQFKWKFGVTDEKINKMAGPVSRFNVLMGGHHRRAPMHEGLHRTF